jgi:transcription elongation factor Elf1
MLIDTVCAAAFYCPACGKVQLQDIRLFGGSSDHSLHCDNCGHELAHYALQPKGLVLYMPCSVCGGTTEQRFSWRQLRHTRFLKLYCQHDHFELGYLGKWQAIAEFLDFNAAEYDALHPEEGELQLARQQLLLAAMNRLHDLVAAGQLSCACGSHALSGGILGDSILLECQSCGSSCSLPMASAADLRQLTPSCLRHAAWQPGPLLDVPGK